VHATQEEEEGLCNTVVSNMLRKTIVSNSWRYDVFLSQGLSSKVIVNYDNVVINKLVTDIVHLPLTVST